MITKTIKVNNRLCDICHSDKQEKLFGECYHEEVLDLLRKDFKKEFLLTDIMRIGDF